MIKIDLKELEKAVKMLISDSLGGPVRIKTEGTKLIFETLDRKQDEMTIELNDLDYPMKSKIIKKTEL